MAERKAPIVGIDLGTTNCAVTIYGGEKYPILLDIGGPGVTTVPSCILWQGGDEYLVGHEAYAHRYSDAAVYSAKRNMGTDIVYTVSHEGDTKTLKSKDVAAIILRDLKKRTEALVGEVTECIITVPAYFNQRQISDTLDAGAAAGWTVRQILKEPTSASYISSMMGYARDGSVLVYDLGGGTFDATYMTFLRRDTIPKKLLTSLKKQYNIDIQSEGADFNDQYFCRVLATFGDTRLGGDDIDQYIAERVWRRAGITKSIHCEAFEKLKLKCENFKKNDQAVGMDAVVDGMKFNITIEDVNEAVEKVFNKTMALMKDFDKSKVNTVMLVGGSTKNKRLRLLLQEAFYNAEISAVLDPDSSVAMGAGAVAKAVANDIDLPYRDVLPLPIGVLVDESKVEVCIKANTSMPYSVRKEYRTMSPDQKTLKVKVYQGLSADPEKCTFLGEVTVDNLPTGKEEGLDILLSFVLTAQGCLKVVSSVEGVDKEEELVIDDIHSVGSAEKESKLPEWLVQDDFALAFYDHLKDKDGAIELFKKRQTFEVGSDDWQACEDELLDLMM